jgi:hypothetical protein
VVEIVSCEVALPEPGVILAGLNEQLNVLGIPLQLRAIGVFNEPDCSVAVTVRLPAVPAGIVIDPGAALRVKVGVGVGPDPGPGLGPGPGAGGG